MCKLPASNGSVTSAHAPAPLQGHYYDVCSLAYSGDGAPAPCPAPPPSAARACDDE